MNSMGHIKLNGIPLNSVGPIEFTGILRGRGSFPMGERMPLVVLICELIPAYLVAMFCVPIAAFGLCVERPVHLPDTKTMTKWFHSTRLETRTKESNTCARSRADQLACAMKVTAGISAPATDQSIVRGLSMSISVRTRKMVNYA